MKNVEFPSKRFRSNGYRFRAGRGSVGIERAAASWPLTARVGKLSNPLMSSAPTQLHPAEPAVQQAQDPQHYRRLLHELIELGMDSARVVRRQAMGPAGDAAAVHEAVAAFERIARAIRRAVMLARKVSEKLPGREAAGPGQHRIAARRRILREVEEVIQRTEGADAETLHAELPEGLDEPELEDEIDDRPAAEIIADICRDLGVAVTLGAHPWKRRMPRDLEALCARAAQPRAAPAPALAAAPAAAHLAPDQTETGADLPPLPRATDAALLPFAPSSRCR